MSGVAGRTYRVAIVGGAGMWGQRYLRAAVEHEAIEPILVDTAERRHEFATHHGIEDVYASLDELLAAEIPDVACCIVPSQIGVDAVLQCAEAGVRAVSCEKPIALELAAADHAVARCRELGVAFGCATAHFEVTFLAETAAWLAAGHIGAITGAAIPGGLPVEVSGAGCVQLTMLRGLLQREVEWVEGWTLPSVEGYRAPEADELTSDCPAYGRLGLTDGIVCDVPEPSAGHVPCRVSVTGENGQVFLQRPEPVFLLGTGAATSPVRPDFLEQEASQWSMGPALQRLLDAVDTGASEVPCSGHDYRQALEIAIALIWEGSISDETSKSAIPSFNFCQKVSASISTIFGSGMISSYSWIDRDAI